MLDMLDLCKRILRLDDSIRFAGIANNKGEIIVSAYRKGLEPLLTKEESELSVMQSVIRMNIRKTLEAKLGKTVYAFALYEKVKRATMPLYYYNNNNNDNGYFLMVSFDIESNHERIILDRILPVLSSPVNRKKKRAR